MSGAQLSWLTSKQFGMWLVIAVPAFVLVSIVLGALEPPYALAVGAGILFNEALEPLMEWLQEWEESEKEVKSSV